MAEEPEPRNPIYFLLLLVSLLFVVTALAYAVVPVLEEKAARAGNPPPPSEFRDTLREHGGAWLLYEVLAVIVVGFASMVWDRLRSLKKQRQETTISSCQETEPPP